MTIKLDVWSSSWSFRFKLCSNQLANLYCKHSSYQYVQYSKMEKIFWQNLNCLSVNMNIWNCVYLSKFYNKELLWVSLELARLQLRDFWLKIAVWSSICSAERSPLAKRMSSSLAGLVLLFSYGWMNGSHQLPKLQSRTSRQMEVQACNVLCPTCRNSARSFMPRCFKQTRALLIFATSVKNLGWRKDVV